MGDLLGEGFALVDKNNLYRCLDKLLTHKRDLFSFLQQRWQALFQAKFDVLLYDLTSTYFECDPAEVGKRRFGYSRDKRSDCFSMPGLVVNRLLLPMISEAFFALAARI